MAEEVAEVVEAMAAVALMLESGSLETRRTNAALKQQVVVAAVALAVVAVEAKTCARLPLEASLEVDAWRWRRRARPRSLQRRAVSRRAC